MATYADVVATTLNDAGIEYVFGVPGSLSSVELIEAAAKEGIRYVLCSNESSAAIMAGTYGILTNRPGVVSTGVGPGAVAAVHGVAHCFLERAPCLVLTDRYADVDFRRLSRQRLDQGQLFWPVTKATFKLATDQAATIMRRAIDLALDGRPGPVHVDLPYDVMLTEAPPAAFPARRARERFVARLGSESAGIEAASRAIEQARRPLVIVGLQVNRAGVAAEDAFVAFAEKLGAPVFASLAAKGTLPEQHPLAVGTFRGVPSERSLIDQADLLIVVGFDPVEIFAPGGWPYSQPVVLIDALPHLEGVIEPAVEVVADLSEGLCRLGGAVSPRAWNREDLDAYRQERRSSLDRTGSGLMPGAVIRIARSRLPDDGFMTVDAGQHKVLASDLWQSRRRRGFLSSSGLGTMAVALPAAIATKLVEPAAPVLCLTGDGGFLMRIGDLETAKREGLAIVVIIFNDGWLNLIKLQQDRRGVRRLASQFGAADYAAIARGLGFAATTVDSEAALDAALATAFASGEPWLIDARINPDGYV